jgi:quercetin dioxygenase-like cupin family protein
MITTGHYTQVVAEEVPEEPGVTIRWLVAQKSGARNFAMRLIEVPPGASTPRHSHAAEHETYLVEGEALLRTDQGDVPLRVGSFSYVPPNERHQFVNSGRGVLRLICVVPMPGELH